MYLYIDETIFNHNGKQCYGVGAFLTENKIENTITSTALSNLANDSDINCEGTKKQDFKTLENGYFHACDDSKNGHSHLCRIISEKLCGNFIYSYHDLDSNKILNQNKIDEYYHKLNTMLSMIPVLKYSEQISIFIEGRTQFTQEVVNKFKEKFYSFRDLNVYTTPFLLTIYPELVIEVCDKHNPGLQVTDFILWAVNNKLDNNKSVWINRLNLKSDLSYNQRNGNMSGGRYILNPKLLNDNKINRRNVYLDIYKNSDSKFSNSDIAQLYLEAEVKLHELSKKSLPSHVSYMEADLKKLCDKLCETKRFTSNDLKSVAIIYIRLFDTLPIYKGLDKNADRDIFEKLIYTKKYLAITLHKDLIHGVEMSDYLVKIRNCVIEEQPDLFKNLHK